MSGIHLDTWHVEQQRKFNIYDQTRARVLNRGFVRLEHGFGARLESRPLFPEPNEVWYDRKTGKTWVYAALDVTVLDEIVAAVDEVEVKRYEWTEKADQLLGQNLYAAIVDEVNFMVGK